MSITPHDPADFTPSMGNYRELKPFRFWCQKVLPLVYDDSLSYYELLCKVVDYLNKTMEDVDTLHTDVENLHTAYVELQAYVNDYFSTLDVQEEINIKLDTMAEDGTLTNLIRDYVDPIYEAYEEEINAQIDTQNNTINTQNGRISVLEGRMDTFSHLAEGSTTGDAELQDIRVGYNGKVYPTAGDAVRGQVADINQGLNSFNVINISSYIRTGYIYSDGSLRPDNNWRCLYMLPVEEKAIISLVGYFGQLSITGVYTVNCFDINKSYLGGVWVQSTTSDVRESVNLLAGTRYICVTMGATQYTNHKCMVFVTPMFETIPEIYVNTFLPKALYKQASVILNIDYSTKTFTVSGSGFIWKDTGYYNIANLSISSVSINVASSNTYCLYIRNNELRISPITYNKNINDIIIAMLYISGSNSLIDVLWILSDDDNMYDIFNIEKYINVGYVNADGVLVPDNNWRSLYMIPVTENSEIWLNGLFTAITLENVYTVTCFDESKNYLGGVFTSTNSSTFYYTKLTLLTNTKYISIATRSNILSMAGALVDGKTIYNIINNDSAFDTIDTEIVVPNVAFSAFLRFGVVGDSLSVAWTGNDDQRNIPYSWGQVMARKYGTVCTNFGRSGATTKTWFSFPECYDALINADNKCQAYIIGIGTNDRISESFPIGSTADINMSNPSLNADSFCGWYGKIIQTIKSINPTAKIFCYTIPYPRIDVDKNNAIRNVCALFTNAYLVDLAVTYDKYYRSKPLVDFAYGGHFSPAGYANIAELTMYVLSETMIANPSEFIEIDDIPYSS